ncbi:NAD(P)/FAD-dependent oxidoreductase [Haladaptatus halobius]|uniref:NAD(P)/FAD-dependent oxidoreductase n=1 Tax=Haladaptatus halobius TaxID=2884875 RepID=UPI001D0A0E9E|nr:FAD-dependent oxidoreductase [Haladaptatus halobius]
MSVASYDIIVVGGGVIGCAVARKLATHLNVLIIERKQIAAEATALAAGEITMAPSYTDSPSISDYANEFFRDYDGTGQFEFTERPSLELVPRDHEQEARRRVERLATDGVTVSFMEPDAVEADFPRFDLEEFVGVVKHQDTGFVDPYTFTMTLKDDAESRGATILTDTTVTGLRITDERVKGVETSSGTFDAPYVVVAAGWRTERFLRDHVQLPIRPYRTQCVVLDPNEDAGNEFPMGWIPGEHVYFRPEHNGDLLVGGWSFAEDDPEGASKSEDKAFRDHVANLIPRFLRGFERARFVNGWAGVDGATPDTHPIIDAPSDVPDGLVIASGFHGRGVMTAPIAATVVQSLIVGERCPFSRAPFVLSRFDSRSPDFEFHSISAGD